MIDTFRLAITDAMLDKVTCFSNDEGRRRVRDRDLPEDQWEEITRIE